MKYVVSLNYRTKKKSAIHNNFCNRLNQGKNWMPVKAQNEE